MSGVSTVKTSEHSSEDSLEKQIIESCKKGDSKGWDLLVKRYERTIFKFAYSLTHHYDDSADITGITLLKVYENIHTFRRDAPLSSWLYCIVKNIYMDFYIRSAHPCLSLDEMCLNGNYVKMKPLMDAPMSPEAAYLQTERSEMIQSAIQHLPRYQRIMIEMYHSHGNSYEEIAKATGLSIGTVKSRMSRARQMLRERLSPFREIIVLSTK